MYSQRLLCKLLITKYRFISFETELFIFKCQMWPNFLTGDANELETAIIL